MAPAPKKKAKPAAGAASKPAPRVAPATKKAAPKAAPATKKAAPNATPATKRIAPKARPAKPVAIPVPVLRELEAALERTEPALQVQKLADTLGTLGGNAPAVAAALLAKRRKGHPVARAYLAALGGGDKAADAANQLVQYCATMERGRKALRSAFVAVWRNATDTSAVDEACTNFARGLLDDPELLDAALDAAAKLGDTAGATLLAQKLERAQRLRPLLADLAGAPPQRARAKKRLPSLSPPDRWHVHARVVDNPRAYDQDLAVEAVRTLADDPSVPDMALSTALVEMRHHGDDQLVAHWKARVAAGDSALITRLLGLFEWTALWATAVDQLEPYIHALRPAGDRPEVFASVEHALAGNSMVVRQAVLEEWIGNAEGISAFDDAQVDKLSRMTVTIAETGNDSDDQRAANRALSSLRHAGARHALMDALRNASTANNDELRHNLYRGLEHVEHPDVLPFLVERMFVEREEYRGLLETLSRNLNPATHVRVLGTLVERRDDPSAVHAATVYADTLLMLVAKIAKRLVLDLARIVIGWQPATDDDARRLRHIFEQATVAALDLMRSDEARMFLTRARELPAKPYSDYFVKDLDVRTPAPLSSAVTKNQLAALEAGTLDETLVQARADAEAARAAGTPIPADAERIGMLVGSKLSGSWFFEDKQAHVVWFFDEVGALHVYDGYGVGAPPCQVVGFADRGMAGRDIAAFIAGHPMIDERALFVDSISLSAREVIRLGDRLLVYDRHGGADDNGRFALSVYGLRFPTTGDAQQMFKRLVANPITRMKRVDPWQPEGMSAVWRDYQCAVPDGEHHKRGTAALAVIGNQIVGSLGERCPSLERDFATRDAAIAAMEAWETRVLAAGGRMTHVTIERAAKPRAR